MRVFTFIAILVYKIFNMKKITTLILLSMIGLVNAQQTYNFSFAHTYNIGPYGAGQSSSFENIRSAVIDNNYNTYTLGHMSGPIDFNPGPGVAPYAASSSFLNLGGKYNVNEFYLNKYDPTGNYISTIQFNALANTSAQKMIMDGNGDIIIAGYFSDGILAAGLSTTNTTDKIFLSANKANNFFVIKINQYGYVVWAKQLSNLNTSPSQPGFPYGYASPYGYYNDNLDIKVNANNDIYISALFTGNVDFDPSSSVFSISQQAGMESAFICKLTSAGNFGWAKAFHSQTLRAPIISLDGNSNLVMTGAYAGTIDLNPNAGVTNVSSPSSLSSYILKLDVSGNYVWGKNNLICTAKTDALGNIYVSSNLSGTKDFDDGPGVYNLSSIGTQDAVLVKLSSSGNFLWAKQFVTTGYFVESLATSDYSIQIDNQRNVFLSFAVNGTCDLDPDPSCIRNFTASGPRDLAITKLNENGGFLWAGLYNNLGALSTANLKDVAISSDGKALAVAGGFSATADFNPTAGVYNLTAQVAPSGFSDDHDLFIAKIQLCTTSACNSAPQNPCIANDETSNKSLPNNGIFELGRIDQSTIIPNPNSGEFKIKLEQKYEHVKLKISNALGEVVFFNEYQNTDEIELKLKEKAGLYTVQVSTGSGEQKSFKMVIE
jgi:hypothetical protein